MIYTSNYARSGKYSLSYAISVKPPDWYEGKCLPQLAPTWELVTGIKRGIITEEEYSTRYINLLISRKYDPQKIVDALPDNTRLLCYESAGEFCHRRVLAKWIEDSIGVIIPEWTSEEDIKKEEMLNDLVEF
jgi:uncharacterized protein YeaO (DUF488 family)